MFRPADVKAVRAKLGVSQSGFALMIGVSVATLPTLPKVGEIIDITYTQTPGGPMQATNLNSSRSNDY